MSTTAKTIRKPVTKAPEKAQTRAAHPRPESVSSPQMVNTFEDAIIRPARSSGRQRAAAAPETRLFIKAWVNNVAFEKKVWVDVDILGRSGQPLHSRSIDLGYVEPAGGSGDFFLVEAPVPPPGPTARDAAPDLLEYHLYYEVGGQVFTDGIPHRHPLRSAPASKNGHS